MPWHAQLVGNYQKVASRAVIDRPEIPSTPLWQCSCVRQAWRAEEWVLQTWDGSVSWDLLETSQPWAGLRKGTLGN